MRDGRVATEISVGVDIGGKETLIPTLVPGLTQSEINHLLSGLKPNQDIMTKAIDHAIRRKALGLSPFAMDTDREGW
jgi:hypothetical protein